MGGPTNNKWSVILVVMIAFGVAKRQSSVETEFRIHCNQHPKFVLLSEIVRFIT